MKRIIAILLVFTLTSGICVFAAEGYEQKALDLVSQLSILQGDENGDMRLEDTVTRAEFTKIAIASSVYKNSVATNLAISPFRDVPYTHWAAPYIRVALSNKLVSGYTDATFQPDHLVLYEEALTITLKLLGYSDADFGQSWPYGQINLAASIGLNDHMKASAGQYITRSDAAILVYNLLNCKPNKANTKYIETLGYTYYDEIAITGINTIDPSLESNQVKTSKGVFKSSDFDANLYGTSGEMLINSKQEVLSYRPSYQVIAVKDANWQYQLGINNPSALSVTRNGKSASLEDVQTNDILYYYKNSNSIFAYTKQVTGIYESASPNKDSLTSIKVSGVSYQIETLSAFSDLASGGKYNYGDTITLLLGKEGKVAGVTSPNAINTTTCGYLYGTGKKEYTNTDGDVYSSYFINVALTDGSSYEYASIKDYASYKNSIVKVTFDQGKATISLQRAPTGLYGEFNAANGKIGTSNIAQNIEILDISTTELNIAGSYISVFPQRLDGVNLSARDILYFEKNEKNEINRLILNNVTGDAYQYGLILKATNSSTGNSVRGSYEYDIKGNIQSFESTNKTYSVSAGQPVRFVLNGSKIDRMDALMKVDKQVTSMTDTYVIAGAQKYLLSDNVVVYKKTSYETFMVIPLSEAMNAQNGFITAYLDKPTSSGGRVRILVLMQS